MCVIWGYTLGTKKKTAKNGQLTKHVNFPLMNQVVTGHKVGGWGDVFDSESNQVNDHGETKITLPCDHCGQSK